MTRPIREKSLASPARAFDNVHAHIQEYPCLGTMIAFIKESIQAPSHLHIKCWVRHRAVGEETDCLWPATKFAIGWKGSCGIFKDPHCGKVGGGPQASWPCIYGTMLQV